VRPIRRRADLILRRQSAVSESFVDGENLRGASRLALSRVDSARRNLLERQVGRDERHGELSTREQHCEVLHAATVGKEFCLPWKLEADLVHPRFMNRTCHNGLKVTAKCEGGGLFQGGRAQLGPFPAWTDLTSKQSTFQLLSTLRSEATGRRQARTA